jgi:PAS domain S-box-containing protein
MSGSSSENTKKEVMKAIILELHQGLTAEAARERFETEVGNISSTEIAEIEQALINEGLSPEEIKKFCNVHALIFQSALEKCASEETFPSHPVYLFRQENREIEKLVELVRSFIKKRKEGKFPVFKEKLKEMLLNLRGIETHYERKEQLLFPFLEKQGFFGPSKVMWGKDNEVRDMLKTVLQGIDRLGRQEEFANYNKQILEPLLEEILGMIFKEENILFPTSLEKLGASDWVDILRESDDIGYVYIEKPEETGALMKELKTVLLEEPMFQDNAVSFATGTLPLSELMYLLNTLPVDLTYVDSEDRVKYFSDSKDRVFRRTRSVIGRKVENCHPPQSVEVVQKIITSFKEGKKDHYEFWVNVKERFLYIQFFAVRDKDGRYLGTLEVAQDITEIRKLESEKRLLDERD